MLFCSNRQIVDCTSTCSSTTSSNGTIQNGDENSSSSSSEQDTNNNNNNNISNEFESINQDETNQQSSIENEGLKAKADSTQKKQLFKRIMYTKEFLLRIQDKPSSVSHPKDLPKFCTNVDGFWDPEKYFDVMKQVKAQAKQQQQQEEKLKEEAINEAIHTDTKLPIQSPIAHGHQKLAKTIQELNSSTNSTIIIEQKKNSTVYEIKPSIGQSHEVIFSSVNSDNNFYVIPVPLSSALNELKIVVNNYCNKHHKVITKPNVDDLILAKSIQDGFWYRAKVLTVSETIYNVFAIDTGKKFETVSSLLLPYPIQFKNIPAFAINIGLAGVKFREPVQQRPTKNDTPMCVLKEFLKRQTSFTIKVLFNSSDKYIVELFNEKGVSFNSLLNPRFQTEIYGTSITPTPTPPSVIPLSQQNVTTTQTTEEN